MSCIQLNGQTYSHKDGEFVPFFHREYNTLKLFPDAGHLERHIGLLKDLVGTESVLECLGSSHGLFVPIGCSAAYDSVWVSDLTDLANLSDLANQSNLIQGIPLNPTVIYVAPSYTEPIYNTDAYVFCPSSVAASLGAKANTCTTSSNNFGWARNSD